MLNVPIRYVGFGGGQLAPYVPSDAVTFAELSGSAALELVASANLIGDAALSGSGALTLTASGDLSTQATAALAGTANLGLTASGVLVGDSDLSGSAGLNLTASADLALSGNVELSGAAELALTASGNLVIEDEVVSRGGHFLPVGIPMGGKQRRQEIETIVEAAVEEVLEDAPRVKERKPPLKRVTRARRARIVELTTRAVEADRLIAERLSAIDRQIEQFVVDRLRARRQEIATGELQRRLEGRQRIAEREAIEAAQEEEDLIAVMLLLI